MALAAVAVLLIVLCFAEAGSRFDEAGGSYLYTRAAFGDLVGFEVGWMTWLARVATVASLSAGFARAITFLWPAASAGWERVATIAAPIAAADRSSTSSASRPVRAPTWSWSSAS